MILKFFIVLIISMSIFCDKQDTKPEEKSFKLTNFVQPLNDTISLKQSKGWKKCNPALDSLSKLYIDSFATEDPSLRLSYQNSFKNKQDTICALNGLNGGYDEYMWILKNLGKPENKHLF